MTGIRTTDLPTNLLADLPAATAGEVFTPLLTRNGCRVERIVSHGQVTPPDRPYRGACDEWVLLLAGAARVAVDGVETVLAPGDHLLIPAGAPHFVTFTAPDRPTVWLAIHVEETAADRPTGGAGSVPSVHQARPSPAPPPASGDRRG